MGLEWDPLQDRVAGCRLCDSMLRGSNVECPPARLYPGGDCVPDDVQVLFVGVAPAGKHFYSDPKDASAGACSGSWDDSGFRARLSTSFSRTASS